MIWKPPVRGWPASGDTTRADPANRSVTAELATRWNLGLCGSPRSKARKFPEHDTATTPHLEMSPLAALAEDRAQVVRSDECLARLEFARRPHQVIEEVIADIDADVGEVVLLVHSMGGRPSGTTPTPSASPQRNSATPDVSGYRPQFVSSRATI